VGMVAPADLGTYRGSWYLKVIGNAAPVSYGPFVVLDGCIAESAHPYPNDADQTWTVTNPDGNAGSTRVHFTRVEVEEGYDCIILKDGSGQECQRITGDHSSGMWSDPVPGRVVEVHLVADATDARWGFCLDQVETVHLVYLPVVAKRPTQFVPGEMPTVIPVPTKTPTPCTCHGVCSCDGDCSCDTVCTCDTVCSCDGYCSCVGYCAHGHYWYPN